MRRAAWTLLFSVLLALGAGEAVIRSFGFRHWLGKMTGRGELQALVRQKGIYDHDVEQAWRRELYLLGAAPGEIDEEVVQKEKREALGRLKIRARLEATAKGAVNRTELEHALALIRSEYRDAKDYAISLGKAGFRTGALKTEMAAELRACHWLEDRIAPTLLPNESEIRRYFDEHPERWRQPARWRASHLFLAAPDGFPDELIESKRAQIDLLARRIGNGESFPALVAELSEDETTKKRSGDLGYFSEKRMLPEIIEAVRQLQPGQVSPPLQSHLGFHLLRLTESLPARSLSYDEARAEILTELENQRRSQSIGQLISTLP